MSGIFYANLNEMIFLKSHDIEGVTEALYLNKNTGKVRKTLTGQRKGRCEMLHLSVVDGECDRKHILGVTQESALCSTSLEIPQSKGAVPRSTEGKQSITRNHDILDKV